MRDNIKVRRILIRFVARYFFVILLFNLLIASGSNAQTEIFIRGSGKLFPIAVPQLCLDFAQASNENIGVNKDKKDVEQQGALATDVHSEITKVMVRDLDLSGFFEVLNPGIYIETTAKCGDPSNVVYSDWNIIGAEGLVRGQATVQGTTLKVKLYLHDVPRQKIVLGKEYEGDIAKGRIIAHRFVNEIMNFFTGQPGVFGTQVVFSSKVGRFKELYIMDMDGSNIRALTNEKSLSFSTSWHPNGKSIVFTSYKLRQPDLFSLDVITKQINRITKGKPESLPLGAKFFKDGKTLLLSYGLSSETSIVLMDLDGNIVKRITTPNRAIDVSPALSPDEKQIAFCSNRAGGPQIYVAGLDGSAPKRISYVTSDYCTSPAWSPKGNKIAFVCRAERAFNIFVSNSDGSNPLQLTSYGSNEDPDWSPDGRYLIFSSTFGKGAAPSLALMRDDGSNVRQLTNSRIGDSDPSWGPISTIQ